MPKKNNESALGLSNAFTFDRVVRILFGLLIFVGIYLLVSRLSAVLLPFFVGWLLAYILNPLVEFFQFKCKIKNRILSVVITLLLVVGVITGLVWLLTPMVSAEVDKVTALIKSYTQSVDVNSIVPTKWQSWLKETFQNIDIEALLSDDGVKAAVQKIAPKLWGAFTGSLSILVGFIASFIAVLYMVFIMVDYHAITNAIFNVFPKKYRNLSTEILTDVGVTMNSYFRGQLIIAACVAVMMSAGFLIIGLPMGIVMGIFVGVCNIIPYMQVLSMPPVAILGLLRCAETGQSVWMMLVAIIVVYLISQVIQDFILTPKIMGKVTGLKPAYILLSISVWGSLLGMIGIIIALPLTQLCFSYYKRFVLKQEVAKPWKKEEKAEPEGIAVEEAQ
jgi:predicted PurR-regulated permease PerM